MTTETVASSRPNWLTRHLPIVSWLATYERSWLRTDFLAGLTVMALLVPEGMAYAELAGMPPQTAFYAAPIGLLLYACFGSSRQLVVAVSSAIAVMSASIVGAVALGDTPEFYALTAALAIMAGLIAILAGFLKLGRIAQFFSESVLMGFVAGLALVISMKQLPKMFGIEPGHGNFWHRLYDLLTHLSDTHWLTLAVGASSLLLMIFLERRFHKVPAALVTMIYGIVVVTIFGLYNQGVHVIGEIPAGLALPQLPDVSVTDLLALLPGAIGITLVMFAESIGPARTFAGKHRYEIDPNQELIGLGTANFGAGLFQGFPIGASLSKSAANDNTGAHSQMSGIIAAGLTALVALFLTPLFRNLPEATLAAIVIVAVSGMFKFEKMKYLYRVRKLDFALAMVALLGVLTFEEALAGLLVAVIVSLLALVLRTSQPRFSVLGYSPDGMEFGNMQQHPNYISVPGLLIVRPDEGIFFANASTLRDEIRALVSASELPMKAVLLDLEATNDLDVPGTEMLAELHKDLELLEIRLLLARVRTPVQVLLDRSGVTAVIGPQNIVPRVTSGVFAYHQQVEGDDGRIAFVSGLLHNLTENISKSLDQTSGEEQAVLARLQEQLTAVVAELRARPDNKQSEE